MPRAHPIDSALRGEQWVRQLRSQLRMGQSENADTFREKDRDFSPIHFSSGVLWGFRYHNDVCLENTI